MTPSDPISGELESPLVFFKMDYFVRACAAPIIIINHFLLIRTDNQQKMNLIQTFQRWFMRLPEMGYGLVYFVVGCIFMYHKYYVQQVHPEYSYIVCDPYVDNPMLPFDKANYISTEMEKIQMHMYGNRTLYHQVHR